MTKIYFILNSVLDAHSIKRVEEFKSSGFNVKVFGFIREKTSNANTDAEIIGRFSNNLSYHRRIRIYWRGIKQLFKQEQEKDIIWYYLGLDVAIFAYHIDHRRRFIYEECDLVHTYTKNRLISLLLENEDKRIISKSLATIMTSKGFMQYHYKENKHPSQIIIVPNKLSREVTAYPVLQDHSVDPNHLRFAFVGGVRYSSLLSIARYIASNYPNHEFHFYGFVSTNITEDELPKANNIFYHGRFNGPKDLNEIYAHTDILVCTYDTKKVNVRYAEPNKLYEAIYFNSPIIVSKGTYLAQRVRQLHIGYEVNAYDEADVKALVKTIEQEIKEKREVMSVMDKNSAIDDLSYLNTIKNIIR